MVGSLDVRVGIDTTNDGNVDVWSDWETGKETYDYLPGFAKQIKKNPAKVSLSKLPEGYGVQFEVKIQVPEEEKKRL